MGLVCQLILFGGLLWFIMVTFGKSTSLASNHWSSKGLTCKNTIRVYFSSDGWTREVDGKSSPRYINKSQFLVAVMGEIVTTAEGNGIQCTFDKLRYLLTCCAKDNFDRFYSVEKEWTAHSKFWTHDMLRINVVFSFANLFLFMLILVWGVRILASNNSEDTESI